MTIYNLLKITVYKTSEVCPSAALSRKWFAQRPDSCTGRFRYHLRDALQKTKFLGEKCGLKK